MAEDRGFLSRWSRRKLAEKEPAEKESIQALDDTRPPEPPLEPVGQTPESAEPERHPAEDVDIDSLTKDSDFTIFMQQGVSVALRRQALRKLWASDPVLANLDGLNDYEDMEFTYGITGSAKTSWSLGRGFLTGKEPGVGRQVSAEPAGEDEGEQTATETGGGATDGKAAEPSDDDPEDGAPRA